MSSDPIPAEFTGPYSPDHNDRAGSPPPPDGEGPGTHIGPYKLLQPLGEGGMGTVFLAEQDEPVQRRVALKVIKAGMDSAQVVARFEAERQALALMDHPNIAKVLDAGTTAAGRPYFVMDLVKGVPITKYCDQHRLTPRERVELFIPVCQAVQHAHQKGIIHRDLKPSNVLVALYDGKPAPKVIDFGVAKAISQKLTDRTMFTEVGAIVGTLEYMAPEQAELTNLDIDTRADIYSLGVLLYELLTGSPPFTSKQLRGASFTEMLRLLREVEPPAPSTRLSSSDELSAIAANRKLEPAKLPGLVRGELDWIAMKALEKDRARRYETANGLAADLQRHLAGEPVLAVPPSAGYRLRKFLRRNRGPVLAGVAIAALLVAGLAASSVLAAWALKAEKDATDRGAAAVKAGNELRDARDELWSNLYDSRAALIGRAWGESEYGQVRELLAAQQPTAGQRDLRGFEWHYLDRQLNADLRTVVLPPTGRDDAPISPDGARLLRFVQDGNDLRLKSFDTSTGREQFSVVMPNQSAYDVTFSTDGKWIVAGVKEQPVFGLVMNTALSLRRWDAATGQEDPRVRGTRYIRAPLSGPEGLPLVCRHPNGDPLKPGAALQSFALGIWDGHEVKGISLPDTTGCLALSADGTVLAVHPGGPGVQLVDVRTGELLRELGGTIGLEQGAAAFSPDGTRVAIAGDTLTVWEAATGRRVLEVNEKVRAPVFSPDGTRIAYISGVDAWIVDATIGEVRRALRGHDGGITNLAFNRDGTVLVTAGGDRIKHWDATLDDRVPALKNRMDFRPADFLAMASGSTPSPDGSRLTLAGMRGFEVWGRGDKPIFTSPPSEVKFGGLVVPGPNPGPPALPLVPLAPPADPKAPKPGPGSSGMVRPGASSMNTDGRRVAWWNHHDIDDGGVHRVESELQLWDPDAGRKLVGLVRQGQMSAAVFSPNGRRLAAAFQEPDEVKVWESESGRELFTLPLPRGKDFNVAFSPDGGRLGAIGGGPQSVVVSLWDVETGQPVPSASFPLGGWTPQRFVFPPAFDSGARRVAVPLETDVGPGLTTIILRVWDVETGSHAVDLRGFKGFDAIRRIAFSPDGRRLAVESGRKVKLWDPDTGAELLSITPDGQGIEHLAFSPDGNALQLVIRTAAGFETRRLDATPRPVAGPSK